MGEKTNILIIGYGNPLCGDDGVGWRVVEALDSLVPDGAAVAIHQLTPEWAEQISAADLVIFVDAAVGDVPGEVRSFPIWPAMAHPGSHQITPDGVLSMAADLFGRCPPAHLVTITGGSFEISESLTPAVAAAVPHALDRIRELLEQIGASP